MDRTKPAHWTAKNSHGITLPCAEDQDWEEKWESMHNNQKWYSDVYRTSSPPRERPGSPRRANHEQRAQSPPKAVQVAAREEAMKARKSAQQPEGYSSLHKEFAHVKQQWREEREARMKLESTHNSSEQDINREREQWEHERVKLVAERDEARKMLKTAEAQLVQMEVSNRVALAKKATGKTNERDDTTRMLMRENSRLQAQMKKLQEQLAEAREAPERLRSELAEQSRMHQKELKEMEAAVMLERVKRK